MIKTQADLVDKHIQHSKYFRKHYEVDTPHLFEITCPYTCCGGIFSADYRWFKYESRDNDDFAVIYCPYCGRKFKECV